MNRNRSITCHLERQSRQMTNQQLMDFKIAKENKKIKRDPLRLNWKDAVVFSLLLIFSSGYHWQYEAYQEYHLPSELIDVSICEK